MSDIEIEIDGKKLTASPNQTVIQVADAAGIYIPRFCYHKHLSIPANCRMCLVEVEKAPKALPACATPVMPGMKVLTRSSKTIAAQRAVMEFLLINHPLDCPICDQGGECELQDLSMGYASSHSNYDECKRSVADEDLGPLIATDMTRCIQCTRCVRFGNEIAGLPELGVMNRGGHEEISTYVKHAMTSEVSGNIIDLCPVGALTSKPYRFTARAWELQQAASIAPHDCVGSNVHVHTRYGKVMRVVARENTKINETWISDRDRFSYTGLYHADRLEEPLARIEGQWQAISWQYAFELAAAQLHAVIAEWGVDKVGALASPNATLEEFYLLQKIMRGLGSSHIDHRLREMDMQDQAEMLLFPGLEMPIAELQTCDAILLIGSHIQKEQPLASLYVRKAFLKGAAILAINSVDHPFQFATSAKKIVAPHLLPAALASVINAIQAEFPDIAVDDVAKKIAEHLQGKQKIAILLGASALQHPQASQLRALTKKLATLTNAKIGYMTSGANSAGAWLAGAIPHRHAGGSDLHHIGLNAHEMLHKPRKAYLLLNVEPDLDCAASGLAIEALKQAKFVLSFSMYRNPILEKHAHLILPIAPFTETSGTFVNVSGEWQSFQGVAKPFASSRPAWKVLRVLANFLKLEHFQYESSEQVKQEVEKLCEQTTRAFTQTVSSSLSFASSQKQISRIGEIPIYATDSLVRRALPLQKAQINVQGECDVVRLHPETAYRLGLQAGDTVCVKQAGEVTLPLVLDECVAVDAAWIPGGIAATVGLGDLFGEIEILRRC